MGFLDKFRFGKKRPEIVHPVFGRIQYQDHCVWELGRFHFTPVSHDVEVLIEAGLDGPNPDHLQFLEELGKRWPELMISVEPILRNSLADWIENAREGEIFSRLKVESLSVFDDMSENKKWELMFWCEEAGHWPTVRMIGWKPVEVFMDG